MSAAFETDPECALEQEALVIVESQPCIQVAPLMGWCRVKALLAPVDALSMANRLGLIVEPDFVKQAESK